MRIAKTAAQLRYDVMGTPIGALLLAADDQGLHFIQFASTLNRDAGFPDWPRDQSLLTESRRQLAAYFAGELREFSLPLVFQGTPFQMKAWQALRAIPFAETRSYAEQAAAIGAPRAVRAIGAANGRNRLPIVVPCHRVIGKDGSLTGFAGGIETKRWLLEWERRHRSSTPT